MIEHIVNFCGGYESWQFTAWLLGSLGVGIILRIKWWWTFPVALFGILLGYLSIEYQYAIPKASIENPLVLGIASTLPILFVVISLFVLLDPSSVARIFGIENRKNDKGN